MEILLYLLLVWGIGYLHRGGLTSLSVVRPIRPLPPFPTSDESNSPLTMSQVLDLMEADRIRLVQDLHDALLPQTLQLRLYLHQKNDPVELDRQIVQIQKQIRQISHQLAPLALKGIALSQMVEEFLKSVSSNELQIAYFPNGKADLNDEEKLHIYRILQEVMTNVLRHANASQVVVHLRHRSNHTALYLKDDGIGIPSAWVPGLGLRSIGLRAENMGARWRIQRETKGGTGFLLVVNH